MEFPPSFLYSGPLSNLNFEYWALQTAAMLFTALLLPGLTVKGPIAALGAVITLALVNAWFWDSSLFLALPDSASVQTLTLIAVNGALFWIVVKLLPGIEISGIIPALLAPIVFSGCSLLVPIIAHHIEWGPLLTKTQETFVEIKEYIQSTNTAAPTVALKPPAS